MSLLLFSIAFWLFIAFVISFKTRNTKEPLHSFDVENVLPLRGMLALFIIFHHVAQRVTPIPIFSQFTAWGAYVVSMFFFITGYGLTVSYERKGQATLSGFWKRRFGKILPPYLLCIIAWIVYKCVLITNFSLKNAICASFPDITSVLLPTSWFIVAILLFYASFYVIVRLTKSLGWSIVLLMVWSCLYYYLFSRLGFGAWWYNSIFALNAGMVYAFYESPIKKILCGQMIYVIPISVFVLYFLQSGVSFIQYHFIPLQESSFARFWHCHKIMLITCLPLFVVLAEYGTGVIQNKILIFLGRISMELYLVQGAICVALNNAGLSDYNPYLYTIVVVLSSILCAYFLHYICSRFTFKRSFSWRT